MNPRSLILATQRSDRQRRRWLTSALSAFLLMLCSSYSHAVSGNSTTAPAIVTAPSGNISKSQSEAIVERLAGQAFAGFNDFCLYLYRRPALFSSEQTLAIGRFTAGDPLSGSQREIIFRLLGVYSQLKYGGDALRSLDGLIQLPTVAAKGQAKQNSAAFRKTAKRLQRMARRFGLRFQNFDNQIYEISLPRAKNRKAIKGPVIALYTHVDVAPAADQWQMADGKTLSPFELNRVGDALLGRGVQSNKNAVVAAMYAMRVIVEEDVNLRNSIKLVIRTDAHTNDESVRQYLKQRAVPDFNISLDGPYPLSNQDNVSGTAEQRSQPENLPGQRNTFATAEEASQQQWQRALLMVASENLAFPPQFSQSTAVQEKAWAASLPNKAQFGLAHPYAIRSLSLRSDDVILEQKSLDQFLLDLQIVTEMIARIGQMRQLK